MLVNQILERLDGVLEKHHRPVSLHEPYFTGNEWNLVKECLDSGWVSSVGAFVPRFEKALCDYTGSRSAVCTVNGTTALQMCLRLVGTQRDEEVLVPALSFVASANAISYVGAIPHFVDSCEENLGVDPERLEKHLHAIASRTEKGCVNKQSGSLIRALIVVHTFGHAADLDRLSAVCQDYGITLIEDAAEALGTFYRGRHVGLVGKVAALSFNGNKIITTGAGGAVLTQDPEIAALGKHLTTTAKTPHPWAFVHDQVGYNFRMANLNAALGVAQMEKLSDYVEKKRMLAKKYESVFEGLEDVSFFTEPRDTTANYWLNVLFVPDQKTRDELLAKAYEKGIHLRPAWELLHRLPMYSECPRADLAGAERITQRLVNLPSSVFLGEAR